MNSIAGRRIVQLALFLAAVTYVWYSISRKEGIENLFNLRISPAFLLLLALGSVFNWMCEAWKWKILTQPYGQSLAAAVRQTLQGASTAFFTPNRSGEFIGKAFNSRPEDRLQVISLSVVGSFFQLLTTLSFGLMALFLFQPEWAANLAVKTGVFVLVLAAGGLLGALLLALQRFFPLAFRQKIYRVKEALHKITTAQKLGVAGLSIARYCIFSTQFVLLLLVADNGNSIPVLYGAVMFFYLLSSFVPGSLLGEIGVRESIALFLFSPLLVSPVAAVQATLIMWLLNILVPAVAGSLLLLVKSRTTVVSL